jgi:hypothetical protein
MAANTTTLSHVVTGNKLLDANGAVITGVTFDAATMLGTLTDNGGRTQTSRLSSLYPCSTSADRLVSGSEVMIVQMH